MIKALHRTLRRHSVERKLSRAKRAVIQHVRTEERAGFQDFRKYQHLLLDVSIAESELKDLAVTA